MSSVLSFRILAQDIVLIVSDGIETIGLGCRSWGAVLQQHHSGLAPSLQLPVRLMSPDSSGTCPWGMVVRKVIHCKAGETGRMKENSISSFPSSF